MTEAPTTTPGPSKIKRRNPWLAALLAASWIGMGHLYSGRPRAAIALVVIPDLILPGLLVVWMLLNGPPVPALSLYLGLWGVVWLGQTVWAVRIARQAGDGYPLQRCNRLVVYAGFVLLTTLANVGIGEAQRLVFQTHSIPGDSMSPTLEAGERVLVTIRATRDRAPQRGDIVVFAYPGEPHRLLVKRVIGLPGDHIEIVDKSVYLNGKPTTVPLAWHSDPTTYPAGANPRDNMSGITVPRGHYFVLGDNRDQSLDSRFFGFVPQTDMQGRARLIFWSFSDWEVRWERMGVALR
ncbi:MAG: signal peptidase I [Nitrospirota bacterium]|nr:signal peptidase I [Nitrospirota bacterium]